MRGFLRWGLCNQDNVKKCPKDLLLATKCKIAADKYSHYFWFSAARNPFDRAFSLYAHTLLAGKLPSDQNNDAGRFPRESFDHCSETASNWGKKERNKVLNAMWRETENVPKDYNPPKNRPLAQDLLEIMYHSTYKNDNGKHIQERQLIHDRLDVNLSC